MRRFSRYRFPKPSGKKKLVSPPLEQGGQLIVYVKESDAITGDCGHVSMTLKGDDGTCEHLSYCPDSPLGSTITGGSLGVIPVPAINHSNPKPDQDESTCQLTKDLSPEEYAKASATMKNLVTRIKKGQCYYSIFASLHSGAQGLLTGMVMFMKSQEEVKYIKFGGGDPDWNMEKVEALNCVSAVNTVLQPSLGVNPPDLPKIPNTIADALKRIGFEARHAAKQIKNTSEDEEPPHQGYSD